MANTKLLATDTKDLVGVLKDNEADLVVNWEDAPHARYCHPREEHLLPLHVCHGTVGRACGSFHELRIIGKKASVYLW